MYDAIKKILNKSDYEYFGENPEAQRSKEFERAYRKVVANFVKKYDYSLTRKSSSPYCECSGFITDNHGKYVYFNSGDYRMSHPYNDIFDSVLVRVAKSDSDGLGGPNNFCKLNEIGEMAQKLFARM